MKHLYIKVDQAEYQKNYKRSSKKDLVYEQLLASYSGLRRSKVLGLKWDAIDFKYKSIMITHTVLQTKVDGKLQIIVKDKMKNKLNFRTLPLIP